MKVDDIYGPRKQRHQAIMLMEEEELHAKHPWTKDVVFNEVMKKGEFSEKNVPDASVIGGTKADGKPQRWVVGNEQGEILPKFLMQKFISIESGKVFGNVLTITTPDSERDRLFALVREAQIRGIQPLAIKKASRTPPKKHGAPRANATPVGKKRARDEEEEDIEADLVH